jgi:hypothetical protein
MTSLSEHLYDKAHGNLYKKSTDISETSWASNGDVIASPPSGKKLCITGIALQLGAAGTKVTIRIYSGSVSQGTLLNAITQTTYLLSLPNADFSECPIILKDDETLQAIATADNGTYVTVRGFVL